MKNVKLGEFNASKGQFDNFRKRFGFKNVKIIGETASAVQETAAEFSDAIKKITEEKGYLSEKVFTADKGALFWDGAGQSQRIFISVKKRERGRKRTKPTPGFKRGRDWLTPLFCANAVGFMVQTALLYKATNF